jgi:hypothetical protein
LIVNKLRRSASIPAGDNDPKTAGHFLATLFC